jgi:uncharacterized protein YdbL (DUF1318 family)
MKKGLFAALIALVMITAVPAMAMSLDQARSAGLVGEKLDGYVGVVKASPDASAVAADINAKRKAEYERISKQNGQPATIVGKIASEQIIKGLPSGALYQSPSGSWVTK